MNSNNEIRKIEQALDQLREMQYNALRNDPADRATVGIIRERYQYFCDKLEITCFEIDRYYYEYGTRFSQN